MYSRALFLALGLTLTASAVPTPASNGLTAFESAVTKAAHDILEDGAKFGDVSNGELTPKDIQTFQSDINAALNDISTAEGAFLKAQENPVLAARDAPFPLSIQQFNDDVVAAGKAIIQAAVALINGDKDTIPTLSAINAFQAVLNEGMQNITQAEQGLVQSKTTARSLVARDDFDPTTAFANLAITVENAAEAAKDASQAIVDTTAAAGQSLADNSVTAPGPAGSAAAQQAANDLVNAAVNAVQVVDNLAKAFTGSAGASAPGTFIPNSKRQELPSTIPLDPATGALDGAAANPAVANVTVVAQQIAFGFFDIITQVVNSLSAAADQVPGGATTQSDFTEAVDNVQAHIAGVAEELGVPESLNVLAGGIPTSDVNKRSGTSQDSSDWAAIIQNLAAEVVKEASTTTSTGNVKAPINARDVPKTNIVPGTVAVAEDVTKGATLVGLTTVEDVTGNADQSTAVHTRSNPDGTAIVEDSFALGAQVTQDTAIIAEETIGDAAVLTGKGALGTRNAPDSKHAHVGSAKPASQLVKGVKKIGKKVKSGAKKATGDELLHITT